MTEVKVGYLMPVMVVKALPDYESYLTQIAGTEFLAFLPKKLAHRSYKVGEALLASVFRIEGAKVFLSQKSSHYVKRIMEFMLAEPIINGKLKVKKAACIPGSGYCKVAVQGLNGVNPVRETLPFLKDSGSYLSDTVTLVRYSDDMKEYIIGSLAPGPAERIVSFHYFERTKVAEILVEHTWAGKFLGRGGLNAATASKLTGVEINVRSPKGGPS